MLSRSGDATIQTWVAAFKSFSLVKDIRSIPPLAEFSAPDPGPAPSADWINDHKKKPRPVPKPAPKPEPAPDGGSWLETHLPPLAPVRLAGTFTTERACLACLLAGVLFQMFLFASGLVTALSIGAVVGIGWALLSYRFRHLPEIVAMGKVAAELERLKADFDRNGRRMAELTQRKAGLEGDENASFERMKSLHKRSAQNEREELGRLNAHLAVEQAALGQQRGDLDAEEFRALNEFKSKLGECSTREAREIEANRRGLEVGLANIERQRQASVQNENDQVGSVLKQRQKDFLRTELTRWTIGECSVSGIGPVMKQKLWNAGIRSAADFEDSWRVMRVSGIGHFKAQALLDWRARIESRIRPRLPATLSPDEEHAIRSPGIGLRKALAADETLLRARSDVEDTAIRGRCKREKATLEGARQSTAPKFEERRRVLSQRDQSFRVEAQSKRDLLNSKWAKEKGALEQEWKHLQSGFAQKRGDLDKELRPLSLFATDTNWSMRKVTKDLGAYRDVSCANYFRAIVFPWSRPSV